VPSPSEYRGLVITLHGRDLKAARIGRGLAVEDMASALGLSTADYLVVERERQTTSLILDGDAEASNIARILGITVQTLIDSLGTGLRLEHETTLSSIDHEEVWFVADTANKLHARLARPPTTGEIAADLSVSPELVEAARADPRYDEYKLQAQTLQPADRDAVTYAGATSPSPPSGPDVLRVDAALRSLRRFGFLIPEQDERDVLLTARDSLVDGSTANEVARRERRALIGAFNVWMREHLNLPPEFTLPWGHLATLAVTLVGGALAGLSLLANLIQVAQANLTPRQALAAAAFVMAVAGLNAILAFLRWRGRRRCPSSVDE
jgi:DNA-binding XRE family transcriptional regulator